MKEYSVAIVGATGAVGEAMRLILEERDFPVRELRLLASHRSEGKLLPFRGENLRVEVLGEGSFEGIDLALFSAGASRSLEFSPHAVKAGTLVVDNSSAFRMDEGVPLVVPEVNPAEVFRHQGIIANPNCSTIQMVVALKPIHDAVGISRVVVTTFQAVSGTGNKAIDELFAQSEAVLAAGQVDVNVYPHQIAFNVLPHIEHFLDNGYTNEEAKMINETRKIFGAPDMRVTATCVRVPVFNSHSESVNVQTVDPISPEEVRRLMLDAPGIVLEDDPSSQSYPMPLTADGTNDVYVGRIRADESAENSLNMWVVSDNLRKGAAANAVQIAEYVVAHGLLE